MDFGVIDVLFISVFLVANVIIGFISRSKSHDITEAVFAKKSNLSGFALLVSMSATMIPATLLISDIQQINMKGLPILITSFFMYPAMYFIITFFLVPRIVVTEMAFSWYEYVGRIYGKCIRVIFSICNLVLYIGSVASLFLVMGDIVHIIFNCPYVVSKTIAAISAFILVCYSAFGGLKAVTITDIFQFFIFFVVVVFLALYFWIKSPEHVHQNFFELFNGSNEKMSWKACFGSPEVIVATLSYWFARLVPDFPQALYQRCYAGRSLSLAKKNMFLASVIFLIFSVVVDFISLQIMASNSELQQEEIIPYLLNTLNFPGLKGLFCIAVLSLAVSTADSELNASSVILANDVLVPLFNLKISADLIRRVIFITGFVAIVISLFASSILDIFMTIGDWIFPLNEFSFLAIMLGIRTSKYVIYFAMGAGFFPVLIYHLLGYEGYACFLGMLGNFFGFIIAHLVWKYFFKSDDPNIYYNQKDNFKRLKDFEYDDEIEREKQRLEEIERQKNVELRNEFKKTLNIKMKEIVEKYKNDENNNRKEIEKIREHVMKDKEKNNKKS